MAPYKIQTLTEKTFPNLRFSYGTQMMNHRENISKKWYALQSYKSAHERS